MAPEEQVSVSENDYEWMSDSDSDSDSNIVLDSREFSIHGMVRMEEWGENGGVFSVLRRSFLVGMGPLRNHVNVVAIHQKTYSTLRGQVKLNAFRTLSQVVAARRGGDANRNYAWFGGSRAEICNALHHGFHIPPARGLCLAPLIFPFHSAVKAKEDVDGVRHIMMCRVILGKTVQQGGVPSTDFDSQVDNSSEPTKYVVWNADMIAHILPCFIISFTTPSLPGRNWNSAEKPKSASTILGFFNDFLNYLGLFQ